MNSRRKLKLFIISSWFSKYILPIYNVRYIAERHILKSRVIRVQMETLALMSHINEETTDGNNKDLKMFWNASKTISCMKRKLYNIMPYIFHFLLYWVRYNNGIAFFLPLITNNLPKFLLQTYVVLIYS